MKTVIMWVAVIVGVLVGGFYALNSYIYNEKQGDAKRVTVSGTIVCLPYADPSLGTKECALGLKSGEEDYYALEFVLASEALPEFKNGDPVTFSGLLIEGEDLPERLRKYAIAGLLSVTKTNKGTPVE